MDHVEKAYVYICTFEIHNITFHTCALALLALHCQVEEWSFEGMYVNHMVVLFSEARYFSPRRDFFSCKTPKRSMYSVHFATE